MVAQEGRDALVTAQGHPPTIQVSCPVNCLILSPRIWDAPSIQCQIRVLPGPQSLPRANFTSCFQASATWRACPLSPRVR